MFSGVPVEIRHCDAAGDASGTNCALEALKQLPSQRRPTFCYRMLEKIY